MSADTDLLRATIETYVPDGFRDDDGVWHEGPYMRDNLAALARIEAAEQQRDALAEALADEPEKWSYETLIRIAELILARDYPPDIFPDAAPEGSTDIGPAFVRACRELIRRSRAALAAH